MYSLIIFVAIVVAVVTMVANIVHITDNFSSEDNMADFVVVGITVATTAVDNYSHTINLLKVTAIDNSYYITSS